MAQTHPNFTSLVDKIQSADDIYDAIGVILIHQQKFQKRYPPLEADEWDDEELERLTIDVEKIDRLYHAKCLQIDGDVEYELVTRMEYNEGKPLYLHVRVFTSHAWDGLLGEGETYFTFDPQVFLKSTISGDCNPRGIWQSMVEDGLLVEEPSDFDLQQADAWRNVPALKFLCLMAVYQKQEILEDDLGLLPHRLGKGVKEFFKVRSARDHRDEDFDTYPDYFGVYLSTSLPTL